MCPRAVIPFISNRIECRADSAQRTRTRLWMFFTSLSEGKGGRGRELEAFRAEQSGTKGETSNTNRRSQRLHHKHLQLLAQASRLGCSDVRLGWTRPKAGGHGPEGKESVPNFSVRKTSLNSLKPSRSSYLQYGLSVAKKDQSMFGNYRLKRGIQRSQGEFLLFFSSPP